LDDNYTGTSFDDSCATSITAGSAPFTGCFKPEQALSTFANKPTMGSWSLVVTDDSASDTGTLNSWKLILCTTTNSAVCGNGVLEAGETCDDSNTTSGDGCNSSCTVEALWQCTGAPSVCTTLCGNGTLDPGEECDDHNKTNGDGCNSNCAVEVCPGGTTQLNFNSTSNNLPIPDPGTVDSVITVPSTSGTVSLVRVKMNVTHAYDGDVKATLISPANTQVVLTNGIGSSNDNYTNTVFDSVASNCSTPIASGTAPYTGCFRPNQSLTTLTGQGVTGNWTLRGEDVASIIAGTLDDWTLTICVAP
jgi:cysteine-rich repeat protein